MRQGRLQLSSLLVIILMLVGAVALVAPVQADVENGYLPGEVLVKLASASDLPAVARQYGLDPTPLDQFGANAIYRLRILDGTTPFERSAALAGDSQGRVVYAEPNFTQQVPEWRQNVSWAKGDDVGSYASQWAPVVMRLPAAHLVSRGAGVTVAVLDTGVDPTHPQLAGHLGQGYDFVDLDSDPSEEGSVENNMAYGHGTHVAGLVSLAAPDATIMPVRVLDADGHGNLWVMAEALPYAADPDGDPATADGADVINLSWSSSYSVGLLKRVLSDVIGLAGETEEADGETEEADGETEEADTGAGRRGIVVVAAAGNSGGSTREYPAAEEELPLLAVAASTPDDILASFSTRGDWVSIAAPGEGIISSVPGGGYGTWNGTSMATALASGTAALVRATSPHLAPAEVVDRMLRTGKTIGESGPARIDAATAVGIGD